MLDPYIVHVAAEKYFPKMPSEPNDTSFVEM